MVVSAAIAVCLIAVPINYYVVMSGYVVQEKAEDTVRVYESIEHDKYLPFTSINIARLDEPSALVFSKGDNLPRVDSATALLPVASAFVTAAYPDNISIQGFDGGSYVKGDSDVFQRNNTIGGYEALAEGRTNVLLAAKPSDDQVAYAEKRGVEFSYTSIGREA